MVRSLGRAFLALAALGSCTDAGLQPHTEDVEKVDNQLEVAGQYCTDAPDEVAFPVKLLIALDQSASLQCTDPYNMRINAISAVGTSLDALPNVEFSILGFASWSRITDFEPDWSSKAIQGELSASGGTATDYQGALSTILTVLEQDMIDSGPAEVARTKYVVVFVSDGIPAPQCRAGCDDGAVPPDSLFGVCNVDPGKIPDDEYVGMLGECPEYNQPDQILAKVADLKELAEFYGAGGFSFNTVFLFAPEDVVAQFCTTDYETLLGGTKDEGTALMEDMAEIGDGTFRDVNVSKKIDFLDFGYQSLQAPYEVGEFFATNMTTIATETGPAADSDMDGLSDEVEFGLGTDRLHRDTDGDNFSDLFELTFEGAGFDPIDATTPAVGCASTLDRDNDGLLECEENFLTLDSTLPDTDGDRMPDGLEFRFGTDPAVEDMLVDTDFDGRLNGDEIRAGTAPSLFDEESAILDQMLYAISPLEPNADETRCYDFTFQGITLVPTLAVDGGEKGINRIFLYSEQEPAGLAGGRGISSLACLEVRYLGETYKDPPSGLVEGVDNTYFVPYEDMNIGADCWNVEDAAAAGDTGIP
jgi:hypothetical protein